MRRTTLSLLALAATLCTCLFTASVAGAQAPTVIDAVDTPNQGWQPPNVTVGVGDTVRWEFDEAVASHNVASSSDNWTLESDTGVNRPPVEYTFDAPGVYTFLCEVHPNMTGSVTVEGDEPGDPLENVLVFSRTLGFRHESIPQGIAALEALGSANDFNVDTTEDPITFTDANLAQYDAVVFLSTTGNVLNDAQQEAFERYIQAGHGYVGIHAASDTEYEWTWYGEMLGGYFKSHPPGTPEADVHIEDGDEPSTTGLPAIWHRTDEWYNFQSPVRPIIGGGGDDYSPRNSGVHVLATVDESTYDEQDDSAGADDHPIAWCSIFDGGRVWYTAGGHTAASFSEPQFRQHILGGIETATGAKPADCGAPRESTPSGSDFEVVSVDDDTESPMELAVADDGRVFYVERITGELNVYDPATGGVTTALDIDVSSVQENGMMGLALSPDFNTTGHLYVVYTPLETEEVDDETRVSRFTVGADNTIDEGSEQVIFTWQAQRELCCHSSGSLAFAPDGTLYISTGDNTNPFESDGYAPIDEREGRAFYDAQRTSANTNNLNGKVLRIRPLSGATGAPGVGTTYEIPAGNMFAPGTPLTRPEIYAMGFRNPFRITIDPKTGDVLLGDYGPDAGGGDPDRGPQGSVEFNIIDEPGFYGWPYCVRDNVPYNDFDFEEEESGPKFDCANPVNDSPNNTGMTQLPPAQPAAAWIGYSDTDPRHPGLGTGGAPTGGPRYDFDAANPSTTKFPEFFDGRWFIGEWNNGWIKAATIDGDQITRVFPTPWMDTFLRPHEIEFGPDGALYVIDWGAGFNGNNGNSGIYRIDYVQGARRPIVRATATPDNGPAPLDVQFSSAGTVDPEGTALTYQWDFGDGTPTSADPNPQHEFTDPGTYNVVLRATDQSGKTGTDTVQVTVGNTRPTVELTIPEDGQFADFGERIPYEVTVTDAEDGTIDCSKVVLTIQLGHDDHAHGLGQQTGCSGTFTAGNVSGHGADANTFISVVAGYTDKGSGAAGPLSASDSAVLQPKTKQAEFYESTGRLPGVTNTSGDPGVQREPTTDSGGGSNIGHIENGDFASYEPVNLKNVRQLRFRVASDGDGGTLEVRLDSPTGDLVGSVPVANTGGWQNWATVTLPLEDPPEGTHELFLVFRHPTSSGGLFNLNWIRAVGKGAALSEAPEVSATATPNTGTPPLTVQFDGTATDADSQNLTYRWDFGVAGTSDDTSTQQDPTYTYERAGSYVARFTATDDQGGTATTSVQVTVTANNQCPQDNVRSDEFDGDSLDPRWETIRPDDTRPPTVEGGSLRFPVDNGSLYQTGTSARNIIVQPLPDGDVEVTAKITTEPLTEDYQQAGLRVYAGDEDWASVHMISAGGQRDIEFIYENDNQPRNTGDDKLGGITDVQTYWVRLISDGQTLRAQYSFDGTTFEDVGRPADISTWVDPKVGPVALSDQAPSHPVASFDWIRFEPDAPAGGGGGTSVVDDFNGTALGNAWEVIDQDQTLTVSGGALRIPAQPGDLYQGRNDAKNLVLRPIPSGPWTATAKLNFEGVTNYQQAGMLLHATDDELIKFGRIAHSAEGAEKFEYIWERLVDNAPTARNDPPPVDSTADLPAEFPDDFWVRMVSDGTNVTGSYSTDGSQWTPVGRPAPQPANAKVGMFAFGADATGSPVAAFDSFTLTTGSGGPAGPSRDDEFDGSALDKSRWNAIVNENPQGYSVAGGELTITTEPGDIYSSPNGNPRNLIFQDAANAGADWTIETKLSGTINGGWAQGGLLAYGDAGNWVKLNAISDDGQTRINRLELRTEVDDGPSGPPGMNDPEVPAGTQDIWLRLKKTGTSYAGEYSFDGTTWTTMGTVTNAVASPDFGVYAFGPLAAGQGDTVSFDYFLLDGRDAGGCECQPGEGDEFDGGALDKTRWDQIVREDATKYALAAGQLRVETVAGDIYQDSAPAATRNFFLQSADHADGANWTIETALDITQLSDGYEQAGLLVYQDDDNYIKFDPISDDNTTEVNRIELRSEVGSDIQASPADPLVPAGTEKVWLRLTKTGTSYAGEYSFDGTNWTALASPVTNPMANPKFGLFTLGVLSSGHTVAFDYFEVDGERGCDGAEPPNRAPVIDEIAATPTSGFAPLTVQFTSEASDPEEAELTYSWDFDGDGEEDADTANASHTYDEPGDYAAKLTVSDGERSASRTVDVSVLEPPDDEARFSVLVFSKTAGFRHDSIDEGHAAIEALGEENGFHVDHTEDATTFRDAILRRYDAVVWLSTTGDVLNAAQQRAFERFIQAGGGFAGVHAAADTEYEWPWYGKLVGGYFKSHPAGTPSATVHVEDGAHHSTEGLPSTWPRVDEWYNYQSPVNPSVGGGGEDYSVRDSGVHVLLTVDEATYDEGDDSDGTNDDHPISWCQAYDGGRSWYTGMGHTADSFSEPEYLLHLLGGIETAAGMPSTECDAPNGAPTVRAAADPDTGRAPLTVRFSAAASDPDGDQLTYLWEFADGQRSFRRNPTHVYGAPGTYQAKVTVTDGDGASGSATVQVVVTNPPGNVAPTVQAAADPDTGRPPLRVRFSSAGSDPDGDPLTYTWEFGDGTVAYGAQATHTYEQRGTYDARVTVRDPSGATGTATVRVRVTRSGGVAGESASRPGLRISSSYDAARVVDKGLRYRVSCETSCRVTSTLRMRGGDEERLGRSSARRIGSGKTRAIVVKLDRRVRGNLLRAMRAAGMSRMRTTLVIRVVSADGTTTLRREVTLTR